MHRTKSVFSVSYLLGPALVLLLLFSATVCTTTTKSQTNSVIAWAQEANLSSTPASITKMTKDIPTGESVYKSESMTLPTSLGSFVILIANEAHESWQDEKHKLITDRNPYYIPKSLVIPQGTTITFLNADAPWDTPHPQTIEVTDSKNGNVVYTTGALDYTNSSKPTKLPVGNYTIVNTEYEAEEGTITVTNQNSNGNLVVGGFYTPSHQVENNKDNDGGVHPGSLQYYRTEFPKSGFRILSEYNFTYATCDYCPGKYWPDNKTGDHTLIIYATEQPLSDALIKLKKMVRDNVYI
ncbi:MAG TPA: hypothetical protein VFS97_03220 [Nitrososphaeraceae archaeon]|nr:hypothetical protein [Nitrososphaeraceae archaeon]